MMDSDGATIQLFSDDPKLEDTDCKMIKEEHFNAVYNMKTEMDDDEKNIQFPFINNNRNDFDEKPSVHVCSACDIKFSEIEALEKHFAAHENDIGHVCALCGETFLDQYHFQMHLNKHLVTQEDTLHKVKKDDESADSTSNQPNNPISTTALNIEGQECKSDYHVQTENNRLIHYGIKLHSCDECSKSFATSKGLKTHTLIHTGTKPHSCDVCLKSFTQVSNMRQHKLMHIGITPHGCDHCGKSFATASVLKAHKMIHSGNKPHSCDECSKSFATSGVLKTHKLIHSGISPHSCDVCLKSFCRRSSMTRHKLIHTRVKPHM